MPKLDITTQKRSALRAAAHSLHPVVLIGDKGLTDAVLAEIDLNLNAHQLIKIKISGQERPERQTTLDTICDTLSCAAVHHLGKTLIIYRPAAEPDPNITRAQRKPSAPYVPKKQAAEGVSPTRKKPAKPSSAPKVHGSSAAKGPAQATPLHTIPRRGGSAMTLRAGMRRSSSTPSTRKR